VQAPHPRPLRLAIDREIAARPELVTIETTYRSPKEHRPGSLQKNQYRELAELDNPDAEPPCPSAKSASSYSERMPDAR
jgi:ParB family chromosome partitioning protein